MPPAQPLYTKESLIARRAIAAMGWIPDRRRGNHGGIGNTLEDLLVIAENNLPIPNAAEWELKAHRLGSKALVTLCHTEPSPRAIRFVPAVLLPLYGWPHQDAGAAIRPMRRASARPSPARCAATAAFRSSSIASSARS